MMEPSYRFKMLSNNFLKVRTKDDNIYQSQINKKTDIDKSAPLIKVI